MRYSCEYHSCQNLASQMFDGYCTYLHMMKAYEEEEKKQKQKQKQKQKRTLGYIDSSGNR